MDEIESHFESNRPCIIIHESDSIIDVPPPFMRSCRTASSSASSPNELNASDCADSCSRNRSVFDDVKLSDTSSGTCKELLAGVSDGVAA